MKKILFSFLFCAAFLSGLAQVPFNANLIIKSGTKDNLIVKGTDTLKLGWRTDRFQLKYNTNKRFIDLIKSDSTVKIYNKLILESPNDTMLSVRGNASFVGDAMVSGNFMAVGGYAINNSFSVGGGSTGNSSTSIFGEAFGDYSFAGPASGAYGQTSFSIQQGMANGTMSNAALSGIANGEYSVAWGPGIITNSVGLTAFGAYNDTTLSTSKTFFVLTDPLFQVANGNGFRQNAFEILQNGKTFIGNRSNTKNAILTVDPTDSTSTFIGTVSVEKSLQVGNNTADTSLIVNGNLKADTIFGVTQMPYQSYVVRLTENLQWTNSGPLVVGETYRIDNLNPGDDFSNVGYMMPEMSFVATGTTPTNWSDGTYILNVTQSNPIVTVLYNSIGSVAWKYTGMKGSYRATFSENYDFNKIAIFPAIPTLPPLQVITQGLTTYEGVGFFLNSYLIDASLNSYQADGIFTDYMFEVRIYP